MEAVYNFLVAHPTWLCAYGLWWLIVWAALLYDCASTFGRVTVGDLGFSALAAVVPFLNIIWFLGALPRLRWWLQRRWSALFDFVLWRRK